MGFNSQIFATGATSVIFTSLIMWMFLSSTRQGPQELSPWIPRDNAECTFTLVHDVQWFAHELGNWIVGPELSRCG